MKDLVSNAWEFVRRHEVQVEYLKDCKQGNGMMRIDFQNDYCE